MEKKTITIELNILAKDILENSYFEYKKCPITRALHRAGYTNMVDDGGMCGKIDDTYIFISSHTNKDYEKLLEKVLGMYNTKTANSITATHTGSSYEALPIEDFTHTITIICN